MIINAEKKRYDNGREIPFALKRGVTQKKIRLFRSFDCHDIVVIFCRGLSAFAALYLLEIALTHSKVEREQLLGRRVREARR